MKKLLFLLFPVCLNAQTTAIGNWSNYLSYNSASYISETNDKIYCIANNSLFYVNKIDNTIKRMSKIKDTGNLLPGHGGILDRIDSILIGMPVGLFSIILFY